MTFSPVTHVIFDMDGLLLDSEKGYDKIISSIASKYGKEYTHEVHMKILGTPEQETVRLAVELMELPITKEEFFQQYKVKIQEELKHPPLFAGAERLLKHLHKHKVPFALATSSSNEATELKTSHYKELFGLFLHKVMGSSDPEVKKGKPHPDIYLVCASRFPDKPSPSNCLVFEDAPNGVKGALAAGMQVVMVPAPEVEEELRKPATLVLNSLTEFKPEDFGLPAF
ncbi:PREDICTED: pseudouridine-5'-phosphatase-like [Nicrophorus vespilloides]|uniref:Pseudouridine-5'-phosphatase-like n=1 Tax=Nicrophorus vespilloides TaxID=110193 RepID=A0ABM1N6U4_NICVS|nr:PREDICTED: pseudouridine-5'-phosphatase-like [Nicrophorus vespilloides]